MDTWLMVKDGVVVNSVYASDEDQKDPSYVWVKVTNYNPMPGIGWTTSDNINFIDPNEVPSG